MSEHATLLILTGVSILGIVLAITWGKFPPVFALLGGTLFLGITTSVGPTGVSEAIASGFADVMGDIGVLVTFGVILGALLTVTDTMQRLVEATLRVFGPRGVPYAFATSLSALFTSIYSDVLLVLSAPLARRIGTRMGRNGTALMGGALTAGIEVGLVFVAPGVAAVAIAGILGVPLGQMFVLGLLVGLPTAVLTMASYALLLRFIGWDERDVSATATDPELAEVGTGAATGAATADGPDVAGTADRAAGAGGATDHTADGPDDVAPRSRKELNLFLAVTPVLAVLGLIAAGALLDAVGWTPAVVVLLTDPIVAIFLGAGLAYVLASRVRSRDEISGAVGTALTSCGPILVLSGISGSLGAVIEGSGMAEVLGNAFSSGFLPPLLLVWLVAAILHIALGSITVSGITAAGILAPIAGSLDAPLVLVALAAGSGALFLPHVNSNFFWMFKELFGFSTRGTFKTHALPMTLASVISLPIILVMALFA